MTTKKLLFGLPIAAFIALGTVVTLNNADPIGTDGYYFGEPQYENSNVSVSIVTYTEKSFAEEVKQRGLPPEVKAFSELFSNAQDKCKIHIVNPAIKYEPEVVGHEFLHCVYGQWHTNNEEFE